MKSSSNRRPLYDAVSRTWDLWNAHVLLNDLVTRRKNRRTDMPRASADAEADEDEAVDLPRSLGGAIA